MEYCSGGDLYTRINTGTLTNKDEMNCYFKQVKKNSNNILLLNSNNNNKRYYL